MSHILIIELITSLSVKSKMYSFVLVLLCLIISIQKLEALKLTSSIKIIKNSLSKNIAISLIIPLTLFPSINFADEIITAPTVTTTPKLKAADLLQSDIQPRISMLKDIELSMQQYESLIENSDYLALRSALRQVK